jgi:hypothetical protein
VVGLAAGLVVGCYSGLRFLDSIFASSVLGFVLSGFRFGFWFRVVNVYE